MYSKKKEQLLPYCCTQQYCCNSPRLLGTNEVHTLGHLESTNVPGIVAARSVSDCSLPFYSFAAPPLTLLPPLGQIRCLWVQKSISHTKKGPYRAQPPSDFRDTSHRFHGRRFSLAQGQQRCARPNLCALLRRLGAMTQGVWSFVQKQKKGGDVGCTRVLLFDILS